MKKDREIKSTLFDDKVFTKLTAREQITLYAILLDPRLLKNGTIRSSNFADYREHRWLFDPLDRIRADVFPIVDKEEDLTPVSANADMVLIENMLEVIQDVLLSGLADLCKKRIVSHDFTAHVTTIIDPKFLKYIVWEEGGE